MMMECLLLILAMTLLGALASLFLKKTASAGSIAGMFRNANLYIGGVLYVISAVLNILILHKLDYSIVLPLTSITYIWTMILSRTVLRERITQKKIGGVCLILVGAVFVSM